MNLKEELAKVDSELQGAIAERARLEARIAGLQAERNALAAGLESREQLTSPQSLDLTGLTKGRAIVEVLRRSDRPLGPAQIEREMRAAGRPNEKAAHISVYLSTLLSQGRVTRVRHGRYVAA